MANEEHVAVLKQGQDAWEKWRNANESVMPDLSGANLRETQLPGANLRWAILRGSDLRGADVGKANLLQTDLRRANLTGANVIAGNLSSADLTGADLAEANFHEANLSEATLREANLFQTNLSSANLSRANFEGAELAMANLREANLIEANLHQADLFQAYLCEANLKEASLTQTNFETANLRKANLAKANLTRANFTEADLTFADLRDVQLTFANLTRANLHGARLDGAIVREAIFGSTNLKDVQGLDVCRHYGPSTIDHRTLAQSGQLPVFLRGCGLPDKLIEYLPSLLNETIQFHSCFISHSSTDSEFATRLHDDLQAAGVRCWFAPEDLRIGDRFRLHIDESIRTHDKLLLVLSEKAITSAWVETEVEAAFEREHREKRTVVFPVRLDDAVMETQAAWASNIRRTRHIGDFRHWKDYDQYKKAFDRLLRDLKPQAASK